MNTIIDTSEIAEGEWDGQSEPGDLSSDMAATLKPTGDRMEFHVQMRGFTLSEMEVLIIEAAARQIVGAHRDKQISKEIETRCIDMIRAKADAVLEKVTTEIIDQPVTPSFGDKSPVTMREMIGLYGREYLATTVDRDGKPSKGDSWTPATPRLAHIVSRALDRKFQAEIEKATNAAILGIQKAIREQHATLLAAETQRIRDAIAKATAA